MMDKKDPGKFTVRFNAADPQQRTVIDLLNQQGRYKAQFLVNAVLHYIHCPETPDVYARAAISEASIEDIVRNVLSQQAGSAKQAAASLSERPADEAAASRLETSDKAAVLKTLEAFLPK